MRLKKLSRSGISLDDLWETYVQPTSSGDGDISNGSVGGTVTLYVMGAVYLAVLFNLSPGYASMTQTGLILPLLLGQERDLYLKDSQIVCS